MSPAITREELERLVRTAPSDPEAAARLGRAAGLLLDRCMHLEDVVMRLTEERVRIMQHVGSLARLVDGLASVGHHARSEDAPDDLATKGN